MGTGPPLALIVICYYSLLQNVDDLFLCFIILFSCLQKFDILDDCVMKAAWKMQKRSNKLLLLFYIVFYVEEM